MAVVLVATTSCGASGSVPERDAFAERLATRYSIDRVEADCATAEIFDAYNDDALRVLHDRGFTGIPSIYWPEFGHALFACSFGDELEEAGYGG